MVNKFLKDLKKQKNKNSEAYEDLLKSLKAKKEN